MDLNKPLAFRMSPKTLEWRDRAAAQRNGRSLHRSLWEAIRSARG